MTTINATINGVDYSPSLKRVEIVTNGPVSSWRTYLDDSGAAISIADAGHPVTLSIDNHVMMQGFVDDTAAEILPEAVFSRYGTIEGLDVARDLIRLFYKAKYVDVPIGTLVNDALTKTESDIQANPQLVAQGGAIISLFEAVDMYLIDTFDEAMEKINYGYAVNRNTKILSAWPTANTPRYNITLKSVPEATDNNILLINPHGKIGSSICNIVKIKCGTLNDHYTERNAKDLVGINATLSNDFSVFIAGKASIRANFSGTNARPAICFKFPLYDEREYLDFTTSDLVNCTVWMIHNLSTPLGMVNKRAFRIVIKDTNGTELFWYTEGAKQDERFKIDFLMGYGAPVNTSSSGLLVDQWVTNPLAPSTPFNWKIKEMRFELDITDSSLTGAFWVDGLTIPSVDVYAWSRSAESIGKVGKTMLPVNRPDIRCQIDAQFVADEFIAARKDKFEKINLICTFQPALQYSGLLVDVYIPNYGIGSASVPELYRVTDIMHIAEPGGDLCEGNDVITIVEAVRWNNGQNISARRILQARNKQAATNVSLERRIQTLEDTSLSGGGSGNGGGVPGGGGGSFDGEVNGRLIVRDNYLDLFYYEDDKNSQPADPKRMTVTEWLYGNEMGIPMPPGADWQQPMGIMLNDNRETVLGGLWHNAIHGIVVRGNTDPVRGSPAVGVTKHFFIRGDFTVRGPLNSHEGVINLYGNGRNAVPGNWRSGYRIGWGPTWQRKGSVFVNLAEGGHGAPRAVMNVNGTVNHYLFQYSDKEDSTVYNEASTMVLVVPKNTNPHPSNSLQGLPGGNHSGKESGIADFYGYGNFECKNVISHGNFIGAHFYTGNPLTQAQNTIYVHSHLAPYDLSQGTTQTQTLVNLGTENYKWENLYVRNIRDKNNSTGAPNQVLTRASDGVGVEWKPTNTGGAKFAGGSANCGTSGATLGRATIDISSYGFTNTPVIVCTPITQNQERTISIVITNQTKDSFTVICSVGAYHNHRMGWMGSTVKNPLRDHTHRFGTIGNRQNYGSSGSLSYERSLFFIGSEHMLYSRTASPVNSEALNTYEPYTDYVPPLARHLALKDANGNDAYGSLICQDSDVSRDLYTETAVPDLEPVSGCGFNWFAYSP